MKISAKKRLRRSNRQMTGTINADGSISHPNTYDPYHDDEENSINTEEDYPPV